MTEPTTLPDAKHDEQHRGESPHESAAERLAAAKRRLRDFDRPEEQDHRGPSPRAARGPADYSADEDAPLASRVIESVTDHFKQNYRTYLVGLGTGASLLALKSSRVRKTLLTAGLQLGASKVGSWFTGNDSGRDRRNRPGRARPEAHRDQDQSQATGGNEDGNGNHRGQTCSDRRGQVQAEQR